MARAPQQGDGGVTDEAGQKPEAKAEQRVEAVERALHILSVFEEGREALALHEIADLTGLYKSTILRLCASLERFGYLRRGPDGVYRLGPAVWRLGTLYQRGFRLENHVRPILDRLVSETTETAAFYVREGNARVCLFRKNSAHLIRHHVEEGAHLPIDRGASAHILLAFSGESGEFYDRVRTLGRCISYGERDPNTAATAAPVFGHGGAFIGALGITGLRNRCTDAFLEQACEQVVVAARDLSQQIGGTGVPAAIAPPPPVSTTPRARRR